MGTRREARERALGLCYEMDVRHLPAEALLDELPVRPDEYVQHLVLGVGEHLADLDATIDELARNWSVERMPVVDRNILRLAAFELEHCADVPAAVVISEAVELAKQYSTEASGRFVNGVLGQLAPRARGDREEPGGRGGE